jgi:cholesterol transport system auxiliary component
MTTNRLRPLRWAACLTACALLAGCGSLLPKPVEPPTTHALQRLPLQDRTATKPLPALPSAPTLLVSTPQGAPGYDSAQMAYVPQTQQAHQLSYFARNEWIDTPARMLAPLIVATLQNDATFFAVLQAPSTAAADLQLDTAVLRLQQNFNTRPSTVTFILRASLTQNKTRRVLAWREFEHTLPAQADTPQAGVAAANLAVQAVLLDLAAFCHAAVTGR